METVFVINPGAGQKKNIDELVAAINRAATEAKTDVKTYITKCIGDATSFVREFCKTYAGARIIACGGDGTLGEVLNGAIGFENVQVGVLPMGTGNDFCRNFKDFGDFEDIKLQITGECIKSDVIRYTTIVDGNEQTGVCANMFNIGFDCNVADLTGEIKRKTVFSGSLAYFISILITLIKKRGSNLKIELDGKLRHQGKVLLTSIANGCFCGGGIKSNPLACFNDGLININIIKNVTRLRFISLLPHYMKGTFLKLDRIEEIIASEKCRRVVVTPLDNEKLRLCVDGEIIDAGTTEFEVLHNAFDFVIPCEKIKSEENEDECLLV